MTRFHLPSGLSSVSTLTGIALASAAALATEAAFAQGALAADGTVAAAAAARAPIAMSTATPSAAPPTTPSATPIVGSAAFDAVARGRYLVNTSGCHDCHTPFKLGPKGPEPDMSRMLSGHPQELKMPPAPVLPAGPWLIVSSATNTAHAGPWGVSFTANLTPDADTGLGLWTALDFRNTIRSGRHLGRGREILPPMPIPVYSQMNDEDLNAIFAYLQTLPAIRNRVPEPWAVQAAK